MSTQFNIDLMHPGSVQRSRSDWFLGVQGRRHLAMVAGGGVALILLVGLAGVLPRYLRHSHDLTSIAGLNRTVATATSEATTLRASLRDLAAEGRRQVRWSELLPALSQRLPESLKIDRMSLSKPARAPGVAAPAEQSTSAGPELGLQIDASTAAVAGGARLEEIANFIAVLATEPTIARRFQVKTWEVKSSGKGEGLQQVSISLAEKRP